MPPPPAAPYSESLPRDTPMPTIDMPIHVPASSAKWKISLVVAAVLSVFSLLLGLIMFHAPTHNKIQDDTFIPYSFRAPLPVQ